tara:strand:+ start:899 stop:1549 length:651 start_codon:yes stop_codon:yes gene_type:complete
MESLNIEKEKNLSHKKKSNLFLLTPCYFAPISHWNIIKSGKVIWEVNQNYLKQSLRNRTYIYGPNKILKLIIPIRHQINKLPLNKTLIDNSFNWQKQHWSAIQTSYNSSPFFEFYKYELKSLYSNEFLKLEDFNFKCIELILDWLEIKLKLVKTSIYRENYNHCVDFRMMSNKSHKDNFNSKKYIQVFSKSNGFKSNLSILDLIFNVGPETNEYLK